VKERPKLLNPSTSHTAAATASANPAPTQGAADQPVEEDETENDDPTGKCFMYLRFSLLERVVTVLGVLNVMCLLDTKLQVWK
jgi:hypothetical protein